MDFENISKNERRRKQKEAYYKEKIQLKKEREKNEKRFRMEEKLKKRDEFFQSITEEEKNEIIEKSKEKINLKIANKKQQKTKIKKALEEGPWIIIDLAYSELMTDKELKKLSHQIEFIYATNKKLENPFGIILIEFKDKIKDIMESTLSGLKNWIIRFESEPLNKVYKDKLDKIIYLTSDSNISLEEYILKNNTNNIYNDMILVIGGLIDRNRHKYISLHKAMEFNIKTAYLPIREYVGPIFTTVLTVNQCFEILVKYQETQDWDTTLKMAIPLRKQKK